MSDLIDRQAAIDAVRGRFSMPVDNLIVEVIGNLPSAQPSYTDEQIQKMQELEQAEIEKAFQLGREDAQSEPQKWIDHNYYLECPSCKRYVTNRTPYCPYCGGRNE